MQEGINVGRDLEFEEPKKRRGKRMESERIERAGKRQIGPSGKLAPLPASQSQSKEITLSEMYTAAVLRALRVPFLGTSRAGNGRVVFRFDDTGGRASDLVRRHRDSGIEANSRDLCDAITWSKNLVFEVRR
jgi:hypothetical protein